MLMRVWQTAYRAGQGRESWDYGDPLYISLTNGACFSTDCQALQDSAPDGPRIIFKSYTVIESLFEGVRHQSCTFLHSFPNIDVVYGLIQLRQGLDKWCLASMTRNCIEIDAYYTLCGEWPHSLSYLTSLHQMFLFLTYSCEQTDKHQLHGVNVCVNVPMEPIIEREEGFSSYVFNKGTMEQRMLLSQSLLSCCTLPLQSFGNFLPGTIIHWRLFPRGWSLLKLQFPVNWVIPTGNEAAWRKSLFFIL